MSAPKSSAPPQAATKPSPSPSAASPRSGSRGCQAPTRREGACTGAEGRDGWVGGWPVCVCVGGVPLLGTFQSTGVKNGSAMSFFLISRSTALHWPSSSPDSEPLAPTRTRGAASTALAPWRLHQRSDCAAAAAAVAQRARGDARQLRVGQLTQLRRRVVDLTPVRVEGLRIVPHERDVCRKVGDGRVPLVHSDSGCLCTGMDRRERRTERGRRSGGREREKAGRRRAWLRGRRRVARRRLRRRACRPASSFFSMVPRSIGCLIIFG